MRAQIIQAVHHIEESLREPIEIAELAQLTGYSCYHFQKKFSEVVGLPVGTYITQRRLQAACQAILEGEPALTTAVSFDFETYAGFYKAFVNAYGCSPRRYRQLYQGEKKQIGGKEADLLAITKDQVYAAARQWPLPNTIQVKEVTADHKKDCGVWQINEEYLLKYWRDKQALLKELAVAEQLQQQGIATRLPMYTKQGSAYYQQETGWYSLLKLLPGAPLDNMELWRDMSYYGYTSGQMIGKLHQSLTQFDQTLAANQDFYQEVTSWAVPLVQKINQQWQLGISDEFFCRYELDVKAVQTLPVQLIHRDMHPGNIIYCGKQVVGAIDFELSEKNIRIFDPCYYVTGALSMSDSGQEWIGLLSATLKGYHQENPLSDAERRSVFSVLVGLQMICTAYFHNSSNLNYQALAAKNRTLLVDIIQRETEIREAVYAF